MKTFLLKNPKRILAVAGLASICGLFGTASAQTHNEKVYADFQGTAEYGVNVPLVGLLVGAVSNPTNAVSASIRDSSTLSYTVSALGIVGATQYLQFTTDGTTPRVIAAGTPIYLKVNLPKTLIGLLGNLQIGTFTNLHTVAASLTRKAGYDATKTSVFTSTNLASALNGAGSVEFKVVPTVDANGVYVDLSAVIGTPTTADIFSAYVLDEVAGDAGCPQPIDWLSGTESSTGIDLASATASVSNPSFAIDNDLNTATTISTGAQLLSEAYYTALFNTPGKAGDSVRIVLDNPNGGLINLGLLTSFTIQAYNSTTAVGDAVNGSSSLLKLSLLPGSTSKNVITVPITGTNAGDFDRVKLTFGGVADASSILGNGNTNIYDLRIKVAAPTLAGGTSDIYAYSGNTVDLSTLATTNTAGDPIVWIDSTTGAAVASTSITASANNHYYGLSQRDGCTDASDTAKVFLHVNKTTSPALTAGNVGQAYNQVITASIEGDQDLPNPPSYSFTYVSSTFTPASSTGMNLLTTPANSNFAFYAMAPVYAAGPLSSVASQAFATTDLTNGLTFDDASATVSGTPTTEGTYNLVLDVYDNANNLDAGQITKTFTIAAALPVNLSDFNVKLDNNKNAVLTWTTESEQGSVRFDVLRSNDGTNYTTIGSKEAAGTSTTTRHYSYTDNNPGSKSYYKLSIVNNDGIKSSEVVSITGGRVAGFSINPNPASNDITISGVNASDIKSVSIYDAGGRLVQKATNSHINVRNLSQGIYFVTVVTKDGNKTNGKFLKK
ncbi:T9SS type A sorting domain-containing protein [Arachidicoccus terrestris]|uniref:T9SS type A sorting domain-containing protein n=1 Tax=Arachidicoccus terrestris TaxID=2875539 RepID=UPI001CC4F5CC|nr:T9SS type A sorting domain-containing protein [Arachidicoccus terrestris]UAY54021.1 T9SS type A sorting domain-containing protein [Arachidicoccus terrestris]